MTPNKEQLQKFGAYIQEQRIKKNSITFDNLDQNLRAAGAEDRYLAKLESGNGGVPCRSIVELIASYLDLNIHVLLGMVGMVQPYLVESIRRRPAVMADLIEMTEHMNTDEIKQLTRLGVIMMEKPTVQDGMSRLPDWADVIELVASRLDILEAHGVLADLISRLNDTLASFPLSDKHFDLCGQIEALHHIAQRQVAALSNRTMTSIDSGESALKQQSEDQAPDDH